MKKTLTLADKQMKQALKHYRNSDRSRMLIVVPDGQRKATKRRRHENVYIFTTLRMYPNAKAKIRKWFMNTSKIETFEKFSRPV